jgi:indole-3-glycerol phosphate synthase
MILDRILAAKRDEVAARRREAPIEALRTTALYGAPRRGFRAALAAAPPPAVIAELKRASPSRGTIRADYDPPAIARGYAAAGATALSVLTDGPFFGGALADLAAAREASGLPCLRKDFLVDPYQVEEARAWGADAVLLIIAAVSAMEGRALLAAAAEAGLDVLVEVHDEDELARAAELGASLIGINNRDLRSFTVTLETTERLAPTASAGSLVVAESGIRSAVDLGRMAAAGARAVLVGEAFMERPDPGRALAEWLACR